MMLEGVKFDPAAVLDDSALQLALGVSSEALAKARKSGHLKFSRLGRRTFYLGSWVTAWLERSATEVQGGGADDHQSA
jgi:hypothetical protein